MFFVFIEKMFCYFLFPTGSWTLKQKLYLKSRIAREVSSKNINWTPVVCRSIVVPKKSTSTMTSFFPLTAGPIIAPVLRWHYWAQNWCVRHGGDTSLMSIGLCVPAFTDLFFLQNIYIYICTYVARENVTPPPMHLSRKAWII